MLMINNEIGNKLIKLNSVDSTNNYAAKLIKQTKVPYGTVIMARHQTKGRGQRNGIWFAKEDSNLLMSVILNTQFLPADKIFSLSKIAALALHSSVNQFGLQSYIKWPNDLVVNKKKVAGILIENQWVGQNVKSSIIGIGLNVNQDVFPESFNATSLKLLTSRYFDIEDVLKVLCQYLNEFFNQLIDLSYEKIDLSYHKYLINYNQWAEFKENNISFNAKVKGVNEQGELILELDNGDEKSFELKQLTQMI